MSTVWHCVIAALYTGAAVFGGLALPRLAGDVDVWTGGIFGLALLLGCGLIHEITNRRGSTRPRPRSCLMLLDFRVMPTASDLRPSG